MTSVRIHLSPQALLAACLVAGCFVLCPLEARAQAGAPVDSAAADSAASDSAASVRPMAPADAAAVAAAMAASDSALLEAETRPAPKPDRDRLELGAAMPKGYFDWLGTLGYRRLLLTDSRFEHWLHAEGVFGTKDYLSEGAVSVAWYIRPLALWRPGWRIRPVVEGGIGGYIVVQFADIEGFGDWSSHARAYVKSHAVAGFETNLGGRWGVALRGRFTIPASRPLDYAQLVLFLR